MIGVTRGSVADGGQEGRVNHARRRCVADVDKCGFGRRKLKHRRQVQGLYNQARAAATRSSPVPTDCQPNSMPCLCS